MGSFYHHPLPESSHSPIEPLSSKPCDPSPNFTEPHPSDPLGTGFLFQSHQPTGWMVEGSIAY